MNKHYYLLLFSCFLCSLFSSKANACGYAWVSDCSSQVHVRINGRLDSFNIADCPSGYLFDGLQLGNLQSLSLANAKTITWESCQNNVSSVQLQYRVYEEGASGGTWLSLNLQEYHQTTEGPYTTRYRSAPSNLSLTAGLITGKQYTLEVFLLAEVDTIGDDFIPETSFLRNNNGSNYKLSFIYGGAAAPPIALLPHLTAPTCHGSNNGNISVAAYGDLTGVFYQWSNVSLNFYQQYNMVAGIYAITVTNAVGQSAVDTMVLGQPAPLTSLFNNIQPTGCNNNPGTATVEPLGGTPPYQYHWENGQQTQIATLPTSGYWNVTVTDSHQCINIDSVIIHDTGQVEQTLAAEICMGETYHFGNLSFTVPGLYAFTLPGKSGCDTLVQLTIQYLFPPMLELSATDASGASKTDGTANVVVSTAQEPYQVVWNTGSTSPMIIGLAPGVYCVTVTGSNGCSDSSCVQVGYPLSVQNWENGAIHAFPNPVAPGASVRLSIPTALQDETMVLELLNVEGFKLQIEQVAVTSVTHVFFQTPEHLNNGIYFVRLTNRSGSNICKIIVE